MNRTGILFPFYTTTQRMLSTGIDESKSRNYRWRMQVPSSLDLIEDF